MTKHIYLLIGLLVLSLIGNGYLFKKVNEKPKTEVREVIKLEWIKGETDTLVKYIQKTHIVTVKQTDTVKGVRTIDSLINVPPSGYIALYSENINTLPLNVNYSLPLTEINRVDTIRFTDSIFIPTNVKWYEKPMFTIPVTAVSTAILFYLTNK